MGSTPGGGAPQQPGQTQDSAEVARACCPRPPQSAHSEAEGRGESWGSQAVRSQLLLAVCSEEPPAPSQMLGAGRTAPRGHGGFPRGWGPLLSCSGVGASLPDQRGKVTSRARERAHRPPSGFIAQDSRQTRRVDKGRGGQSPDPRAGELRPPRQVTCPLWPVTRELDGLPNTHQLPQRPETQPCSTHSQLFPPAAGRPHLQRGPWSAGRPCQQGDPGQQETTPISRETQQRQE